MGQRKRHDTPDVASCLFEDVFRKHELKITGNGMLQNGI